MKKILHHAYIQAKDLLRAHRDQLHVVVQALLQSETLDGKAFKEMLSGRRRAA